jgi:tetrahydromethanopterin S-methyltransferase subunit G
MNGMPVFVKVEEYKEVLELMQVIDRKLEDAKDTLLRINDLKNEEDHLVEQWQNGLADIEKKVEFIKHTLSEPQHY